MEGTYGCTKEACEFRDAVAKKEVFKRTECDIIGISCDPPEKQKMFVDQHGLPYPVLSDTTEEASKLYSVNKGFLGLSKGMKSTLLLASGRLPDELSHLTHILGRATFFIDRDGTVLDVYESVIQYSQHVAFVEKRLAMLPETLPSE